MKREEFSFRVGKAMFWEALLGKLDMEEAKNAGTDNEEGADREADPRGMRPDRPQPKDKRDVVKV